MMDSQQGQAGQPGESAKGSVGGAGGAGGKGGTGFTTGGPGGKGGAGGLVNNGEKVPVIIYDAPPIIKYAKTEIFLLIILVAEVTLLLLGVR